jgi:hypothetical protein
MLRFLLHRTVAK